MSNPYGGGEGGVGGGEMGGGDMCGVSLPTMQTMSILQGLLNMNPAALPGGAPDMGGAMSGPMNAGMPGMGAPMDGGAGSFLSNMPSFLPSMNPDMAGALAGAFAGGMGALMDSFAGAGGGAQAHHTLLLVPATLLGPATQLDQATPPWPPTSLCPAIPCPRMGGIPSTQGTCPCPHTGPHMLSAPPSSAPAPVPSHSMPSHAASPMHHTSMAPSMSGGSVRSVDPLAGVAMGAAGVAAGAGILAPVVSSLLSAAGGKSLQKLDNSDASSTTMVGDDSLNSSSKTVAAQERPASAPSRGRHHEGAGEDAHHAAPSTRVSTPKDELEDDKASVGAESVPSSEEAGDGKSDTESVRKKTPSPVLTGKLGRLSPTGSESTPVLESASCASITDLASATESMRDSDTDNHSDAHNVTANLSDLDNDLHETQPKVRAPPQYAVGALPIVIEKPTFGWQSMVGLDTAKDALKNLFMSESFPEVFEGTQGTCKGVLLFGPSGSGKTCLARALAKETNDAILIGISTAYLASQAPLEAPKIVRYLFDHARMHTPAVILFDEVDALCYDRSSQTALRAKAELLAQIRGLTTLNPPYPAGIDPSTFNDGLMVLGTTNQPWLLEEDLRRIFTYNIHVKLPNEKAREELLRMFLQNLPHNINDDQFKCLVAKSEGYSAADINTVIRQVAHMPPSEPKYIQNPHRVITYDDLATVMTDYRCRFTEEVSVKYQRYIKAATHRSEERREDSKKDGKKEPKGVKRFGQRIAKSLAAALVAVID
ncbi:putative vacuolar protein sorting-associated protein 4B [Penaeus vannamei]|uniref:Putative vacuolar protein sorting-associated protein 4B n=1 Tax=Penaeus vannamei TaxID=6689 RepID=A0A3R7MJI9_PENVA|nr:putative vacuolar protein sorting-associated protein 4B [Penaeus vannamei]